MKTNVIILFFFLLFGFAATAQEAKMLKKTGDIAAEKQMLKTDIGSVSALQTKKLSKFLNLSDNQFELVNGLIGKHLKSDKYAKLLSQLSGNTMSKAMPKKDGLDSLSAELYNDTDFTKDINVILDDKQKESYKEMVNKFLTPR